MSVPRRTRGGPAVPNVAGVEGLALAEAKEKVMAQLTKEALREVIRPMDVVLAVLLSALGVLLMVENMHGSDKTRIDSTSWLLIPVFLLATLPILFRRANMIAVILVTAAAMAVHVAAFGWLVRCGAGLPLALVLAYSAGKLVGDRTQSVIALVLTVGVQLLVLVQDSAAGLGVLPFTAVFGAVAWGIGLYVRTQAAKRVTEVAEPVTVGSRA
jgi:hypothetical protein